MDQQKSYWEYRKEYLRAPLSVHKLRLHEIRQAGTRLAGDRSDLRLFGLPPSVWYALGVRIQGRTVVEATRDPQARFFARAVAKTLGERGHHIHTVIDPFVGSGNVLYHFMRETNARHGIGIDLDPAIGRLTTHNFAVMRRWMRLGARVDITVADWTCYRSFLSDRSTLVLVMPPWGEAFTEDGLDLRQVQPRISQILADLGQSHDTGSLFAAIMTFPKIAYESVAEISSRYRTLASIQPTRQRIAERIDYVLVELR